MYTSSLLDMETYKKEKVHVTESENFWTPNTKPRTEPY